jgi:hypothetical protein
VPAGAGGGSIIGSWTHSHEEDAEDRIVFRPVGTQLPRARGGRETLELDAGGELRHRSPGPDDRRVEGTGAWTLEGDELTLKRSGSAKRYRVELADDQQLVLRTLG